VAQSAEKSLKISAEFPQTQISTGNYFKRQKTKRSYSFFCYNYVCGTHEWRRPPPGQIEGAAGIGAKYSSDEA
jgi:hypothetical protein